MRQCTVITAWPCIKREREMIACTKQPVKSHANVKSLTGEVVIPSPRHHGIWKLQTSDQQILRNKHYAEVHHGVARTWACSWKPYPQFWWLCQKPLLGLRRDHVLDNCPQKLCVKRFHSWWLAGPIDSKRCTPIKLIGLLLDKAVKIKGINPMIIPFE
jgi:hypothetical protein